MADLAEKAPRVFLSYSYDSSDHRAWVMELATRLRGDGVETILDKWELEPGDPLPEFMERAVRENDFVLIICTPGYKDRSDRRVGGVGYEEDIMTAEVFTERNQRKFKPVLRSGDWKDAAPTWLTGKLYVDLKGESYSEEQYRELLQSLLGTRPKAPPVRLAVAREERAAITDRSPAEETEKAFEPIKILLLRPRLVSPKTTVLGAAPCTKFLFNFRASRPTNGLTSLSRTGTSRHNLHPCIAPA